MDLQRTSAAGCTVGKGLRRILHVAVVGGLLLGTSLSTACGQSSGVVWTWGRNAYYQLGDGTTDNSWVPQQVGGLEMIVSIAAGYEYTAAVAKDGTLWGWGRNDWGQLGNGTTANGPVPAQVPGLADVIDVSAGHAHTAALLADGTVWNWGANHFGQLGDGTTTHHLTPIQAPGVTNIVAISSGRNHTVALRDDGTLLAWGRNDRGQIGDGSGGAEWDISPTPVQVAGLTDVVAFDAGCLHTVAVSGDGAVWSWGSNTAGELGDGTTTDRATPGQVPGLADVVDVSAGGYWQGSHTTAIKADGTLWAWGWNKDGQLGDATTTDRHSPVQVTGPQGVGFLSDVVAVDCGTLHTLAVAEGGAVFAWGGNVDGRLGIGTNVSEQAPVQVADMAPAISIFAGGYHSGAVIRVPELEVAAEIEDSLDWVYQNTSGTFANGGHSVRLEISVLEYAGNDSVSVSVEKAPGSGAGEVTVEDDPGGNPLVKLIIGGLRTDGVAGTGPLVLAVTATGNLSGEAMVEVPLVVRQLADVDGNGAPEPGDVSLLVMELNGNRPPGYHANAFDLDANGAAEPGDVQILINVLNGQPVP